MSGSNTAVGVLLGAWILGVAPDAQLELLGSVPVDPGDPHLALGDVDGDGRGDLCIVHAGGIDVHRQRDGRFTPEAVQRWPWPAADLAWSILDVDGDGTLELLGFVDAREVRTWSLVGPADAEGLGEGTLQVSTRGQLPRGRFPMQLLRDVDGDGRLDLVLPEFGRFAIHLRRDGESPWAEPLTVQLEAEVDYELGSQGRLDSEFGQDVEIPWFNLRDVDGDGRADLVAETEDSVSFHLAQPEISDVPTWTLDLAALRRETPRQEKVDFDDLLSSLGGGVDWSIDDLDGEAPHDLVVQVGSKFRVYKGGARSGASGTPDQVLKASGNVLGFLVEQVLEDPLPELILLRGERLSLARVLRWLVLPGGITFDLFTYGNEAGRFSTRPTKRNALELRFPRLLSLIEDIETMEDAPQAPPSRARRTALDADGRRDDVLDVLGHELVAFRNVLEDDAPDPSDLEEQLFRVLDRSLIEELERMPDGGTKTFHLDDLLDSGQTVAGPLREACAGREPDLRAELPESFDEIRVHPVDLDGEGPLDVLLLGRDGEGPWTAQLLRFR